MLQVAALTVFALLLARMMRAPAGTWRYVLGAAAAALVASQLLPAGNAWRADVAGSARTLFWLGLGLAPIAAYAVALRRLRRRTAQAASPAPSPATPRGLVQFADDAALAAETARALAADAPGARLSLGWRGDDATLEGHLQLVIRDDLAEVVLLRVAPQARRQGIGRTLLRAAESEARARGARRIGALVADWQAPGFFERAGYHPGASQDLGGGAARRWMEKPL